MAMTGVLLDTSVLTRLRVAPVRAAVEDLGPGIARTTLTDLELGFPVRSVTEWDALQAALATFRSIDVEARHVHRARHVQRALAEAGLRGRKVPDLVIAACAEDRGLTVAHYDRDFEHIATVTGQDTMWIVPPGTVD
jgi:predicted nucleic acid-binding protein